MGYTYTPTYYSSLHDSIATLCKNILPFSSKRRLPSAEQRMSEMQSENLKWQQDSFHQILNLMGLHKEGILGESEVCAFRTHLLETLIVAPVHQEHPAILRDKLLFLQELLYAKCITLDEYHSSKRPLLQRLAVQGAEIEARDVIVGPAKEAKQENNKENNPMDEEWSVIDLKDENRVPNKESSCHSKSKSNMKQHFKGAASAFGFGSLSHHKPSKGKPEKSVFDKFGENPGSKNEFGQSILMAASSPPPTTQKPSVNSKRKPFRAIVDGLKKWKRTDPDDETLPLSMNERSCNEGYSYCLGEGPDTKLIKRKLHSDGSPSDFFVDKVLGEKIKKELSRIQTELCTTNPSLKFSNEQIEAISTKLPVDKADLKNFFPKTWCDQYGDLVLGVVKKEFKDHVGEMEKLRNAARERHNNNSNWTSFDDDDDFFENSHPNLFEKRHQNQLYEENPFCSNNQHQYRWN